ncbi:MAG: DUF262 domain-containing protein [Verrucomicrobiales bacterium]|nr:DUF262 domain-containing protein [Verrucomicrobiales bacterium]
MSTDHPDQENDLGAEISQASESIYTDNMSMSVGEFLSLYKDNTWIIAPEFQRLYRWNLEQKSRFIESLLLGFPIPPFYVAINKDDGKYLTIDGLQRLSTILEFTENLSSGYDNIREITQIKKSGLRKQQFLPSLEGMRWGDLSLRQQRIFKSVRLDLKILQAKTGSNIKFEVFNRLNSGQANLSAQEVRNCLILMYGQKQFDGFNALMGKTQIKTTLTDSLSEAKRQEAYDQDMIFRMIVATIIDPESWKRRARDYSNIAPLLDSFVEDVFNFSRIGEVLQCVETSFELIHLADPEFQFKKYVDATYTGEFSVSLFEYIAIPLCKYLYEANWTEISSIPSEEKSYLTQSILNRREAQSEEYLEAVSHGARPVDRFYKVVELGNYRQ